MLIIEVATYWATSNRSLKQAALCVLLSQPEAVTCYGKKLQSQFASCKMGDFHENSCLWIKVLSLKSVTQIQTRLNSCNWSQWKSSVSPEALKFLLQKFPTSYETQCWCNLSTWHVARTWCGAIFLWRCSGVAGSNWSQHWLAHNYKLEKEIP